MLYNIIGIYQYHLYSMHDASKSHSKFEQSKSYFIDKGHSKFEQSKSYFINKKNSQKSPYKHPNLTDVTYEYLRNQISNINIKEIRKQAKMENVSQSKYISKETYNLELIQNRPLLPRTDKFFQVLNVIYHK